jgi:hypothetical protein
VKPRLLAVGASPSANAHKRKPGGQPFAVPSIMEALYYTLFTYCSFHMHCNGSAIPCNFDSSSAVYGPLRPQASHAQVPVCSIEINLSSPDHCMLPNAGSFTLPPASPSPATGRLYDHPANCCCMVCESIGPSTYESAGASEVNSRSKFAVSRASV